MNPDRLKWTDSRLDDRFDRITSELRAGRETLREVRDQLVEYIEDQRNAHEAQRLERKSDRRWIVGSVFTAAGLIIAAVGLLVGHIG